MKRLLLFLSMYCLQVAQAQSPDFLHWETDSACNQWVNETYGALGLEQRVAQFFMVAAYTDTPEFNMLEVEALAKKGRIGGVIFFRGHPTAQAYWTNRLQAVAKLPLMIGIDGEWGLSMRLDSTPIFPHQLTLGAIHDTYLIREMGKEIGRECKRIGVHVNFAPDVDINSNPHNPVINDRSFGEDKMQVAVRGVEYADGMQQQGVLACAKHFPGHGDTDKDSHLTLPTISKPQNKLDEFELFPFKALFANGVGSVMVAHLNVPALDGASKLPASLSARIIQQKLQKEMGYNGLVFSDALNMRAISDNYAPGVVDSIAFMAGNDVLLFSKNSQLGVDKITNAWANGKLEETYMEKRVKKVLAYKYLLGLKEYTPVETENLYYDLNNDTAANLRRELYENALTLAANTDTFFPIRELRSAQIASVCIDCKATSEFQRSLFNVAELPLFRAKDESEASLNPLLDSLQKFSRVIIDVHGMSRQSSRNYGLADATVNFINTLAQKTKVGVVLFGSPYSLRNFDSLNNVMVAYEDNEITNRAAANAAVGAMKVSGRLPVSASRRFTVGTGLQLDSIYRLKQGVPEEAGLRTDYLREMDDIVLNGIIAHAYPGCQLLIARNNTVVWNKAYGSMTYEDSREKINENHLYDLASVSKIAATTLAIMKLYDEKKIDLNKTVGDYVALDDSATIRKLKLADILTHQAGLKAFYEFYRNTIDSNFNKFFRFAKNDTFIVPVCHGLYCTNYRDTMWYIMAHSPIKNDPGYLYSDIDFYILQKVVEQVTQLPLDVYVDETFYAPMGLTRITYRPTEKFPASRIAPTENDTVFRKQVVKGFVHDPGAALYGGVAGHAGVFSNAFDLAQLMQLLLNKGVYNGQRFFSDSTVHYFTKQYSSRSRRGLGFDKPEPDSKKLSPALEGIPLTVFGHTGFTGTCVWTDPTNQLTFIFLSNRVYPTADNGKLVKMNIRSALQKVMYKSLK
ncbi:MAG: glycoside hydrolase family 3 N-terminal domain-containing protein [Chitinophagales bacterium]